MMTAPATGFFEEITEAQLLPRVVRIEANLYAAVFDLMKLVPARYILRRALADGKLEPGTVIVETTSGTFGLALAMQAALMERELILVSDPIIDASMHRKLRGLGAAVEIVPKPAERGGYQAARLARLAELRSTLARSYCPEQYSNPDNPNSYAIVADHLAKVLGTVDCVVGTVGSGGSMCGTVPALRSSMPRLRAIAVDTYGSSLFGQPDAPRMLRGLGNSLLPPNLRHEVFDEVHWCTAAEAYAVTRWAYRRRALFQGPTSGAALLVARWWARHNTDARCVVILPDAGHRYLDTAYNDGWIRDQGLRLTRPPDQPAELSHPAAAGSQWARYAWQRRTLESVLREEAPPPEPGRPPGRRHPVVTGASAAPAGESLPPRGAGS